MLSCQHEQVQGAHHTGLGGVDGFLLIMPRRGRTGKVIDGTEPDRLTELEREDDVMMKETEIRLVHQRRDVLHASCRKIVNAQHMFTF